MLYFNTDLTDDCVPPHGTTGAMSVLRSIYREHTRIHDNGRELRRLGEEDYVFVAVVLTDSPQVLGAAERDIVPLGAVEHHLDIDVRPVGLE